ncbi:MAG: Fur family transcriptional regulator [Pseudomonadota bacterium]
MPPRAKKRNKSVSTTIREVEQRCQSLGIRFTDKRKLVFTALLKSDKPMSAYELADYCRVEYGQAIPAMSVYRILDFFQSQHLAHKLSVANKYVACAHITCDHPHGEPQFLICSGCHRVNEISLAKTAMNALKRSVEDAGFQLTSSKLEVSCLCDDCANTAA